MDKQFGIDAGSTLIKLAYPENGTLHFKKYSYQQQDSLLQWLQVVAPEARITVTGGKSHHFLSVFDISTEVDEFTAVTEGAKHLIATQKLNLKSFILVNIGTGTSFFSVKEGSATRLYGSGVGGGMFTGLSAKIVGKRPFSELVALAETGNRSKVDLQVRDIYEPNEPPIPGHFTASNFGKAMNADFEDKDVIASLIGLVAETTMLLSVQSAAAEGVTDIVFTGGMTAGNPYMKKCLKEATESFGYHAHFLENGEYCGALGALNY